MTLRYSLLTLAVGAWLAAMLVSCIGESKQEKTPALPEDDIAKLAALPTEVPAPADNPSSPEKVALGRLLFFDPILSGLKT